MIIGDKKNIAVEFELDKNYGGTWLFGKICYWSHGKCIGNYDLGTSLRDVLFLMRSIVRDNGTRGHNKLFDLDLNNLYDVLNNALYGCEESAYEKISTEETWARFDICIRVDVFDGWKIFLIEKNDKAKLIVKEEENRVFECVLLRGEFDEVITNAYKKLDALYEGELRKEATENI